MIKPYYRKRKILNGLFLELELELDLGVDLGENIAIAVLRYKIVTQNKDRVLLEIYDTESYDLTIKSKLCRFHDGYMSNIGEGIYVENRRELYRFLRQFENDLEYRLNETIRAINKPMDMECKGIVERVLENI